MSSRAETVFAIVGGSILGAIAAFMTGETPSNAAPPDGKVPFRPVASVTRAAPPAPKPAPAAPSAAPSASASDPASSPAPPGARVWELAPFNPTPATLEQAELECSRGTADPCMHAGLAYLEGRGTNLNETRAKLLLSRARKLYLVSCQNRKPEACLALSQIYMTGIATIANPENAQALEDRARKLCAGKTTPVCSNL